MKISIITPSLNQGKFIEKTIQSVINQHYSDYEHFIIDGGSHDETLKILRNYELRTTNHKLRWVSEKDKGQADAINKGLRMATGDIIGVINSDDYYEAGTFKEIMTVFQNYPCVMWVTGDCRIVNEKGKEIQRCIRFYKKVFRLLSLPMILPILNPLAQSSTFIRKHAIKKIGYFDESLAYAFDYDFWLRLQKFYSPIILSKTLSSFRIHKNSKGKKYFREQFEEELSVLQRYTQNPFTFFMHRCHNWFVVFIYRLIK
jgi:glycosyltransferase involved in cell wall biosynthesis